MNYPIEVRKIAAEVPLFHYSQMETWQALYQSRDDENEIKRRLVFKAADQIVHKFVGQLIDRAQIKTFDEPDGKVIKVTCVALSYDELCHLLYRAYSDGQSDGMRRSISLEVPR